VESKVNAAPSTLNVPDEMTEIEPAETADPVLKIIDPEAPPEEVDSRMVPEEDAPDGVIIEISPD
jgi:hypothetical protein